jgi:hypothetical protein
MCKILGNLFLIERGAEAVILYLRCWINIVIVGILLKCILAL